jgi:hypothetical protein
MTFDQDDLRIIGSIAERLTFLEEVQIAMLKNQDREWQWAQLKKRLDALGDAEGTEEIRIDMEAQEKINEENRKQLRDMIALSETLLDQRRAAIEKLMSGLR